MANSFVISSSSSTLIGAGGDGGFNTLIFEVSDAVALAADVKTHLTGSTGTVADNAYYNVRANPGLIVAAGTDITANGVYAVKCPGMTVTFSAAAGSCNLVAFTVEGTL